MSGGERGGSFDVVATKTFDVLVSRVWDAWTRSEDVVRWWGPHGFTAPLADMDVRVGGSSHVCMRSPDGHDLHNLWTYQVVQPEERLELMLEFCDASGQVVDPAALGLPPGIPVPVRDLVTFRSRDEASTELTVTEYGYASESAHDMSLAGLQQCLDKMEVTLPGA